MANGKVINIWVPCDRQRAAACHPKEPKGKKQLKSENISSKRKENAERKEAIAKGDIITWTSMCGHCLLVGFLVFSIQYSQYRISKYWILSSIDTRKY